MGKELDQQKISFVAVGAGALRLVQIVLQKRAQALLAGQTGGLEKLPQLMHLDALVHLQKPLAGLFNRFLRRSINAGFQVAAGRQLDHELAGQGGIQGVEQTRRAPLRGRLIRLRYFGHGFTIQLATSRVKRAATAVGPPVYCKATTEASASKVPSEFCSRNVSANSRGRVEANNTSRAVPNSMIVLSVKASPSFATRVKRTGMRTGLASGKNFASLAVELSRLERAVATASFGTGYPRLRCSTVSVDAAWVPRPAG